MYYTSWRITATVEFEYNMRPRTRFNNNAVSNDFSDENPVIKYILIVHYIFLYTAPPLCANNIKMTKVTYIIILGTMHGVLLHYNML